MNKISVILPYKENFSPTYAGAVSLHVEHITLNSLYKKNVSISPLTLFDKWFNEINISNINSEINAMTLSTIDRHGFPKGRVVLLKYYSENGFTFFSNYDSEKSTSILNNNKVSISFFWEEFERQVIIKGFAKKTSKKLVMIILIHDLRVVK